MSTTIDQRVVEMRFDNKQFEQNVNTSMSTLDKLKQKLNLSGASKGLENINAAAKNNNLSALGNAASTVASKFSAMEIMGVTALANITNSAVNAGKRMVAALTIEPVKTGFNEYELKMDSVKTIMASTGESVQTVNKYLNELNEYSDQTIYSFSDMTQNIGKFTNAGVKLEDAVMAIKGISNEAAVSGANANEASRAMYNFAQALSAGYVKLIDWKSIENANMATVEFKQQLIDTAVELGTVTKAADGMYMTLDGNAFSATKNFNEVFQDQWMTSEVLVETLKDYADETTEIGAKAKKAAQDVTKLSQVFDIAKETAQSGWARTWEILFGDIESAKALFTPISEFINKIIDGMSDFRNNILEGAFASPFKGLAETLDKVSGATETVSEATKNLGGIIDDVIGGKFGNGKDRIDALTKAGYNWAEVQNKVNEKLGSSVRHNVKLAESQEKVGESQQTRIRQLLALSDAELKNRGLTEKEIEALRELERQSEKTGIPIEDLVKDLDQLSGRSLLIESFKNAGKGLASVFGAMKGAWQDIFPPKTTDERAKQLYEVIAAIHKFSTKLLASEETVDKLTRTFKGLFAAIDIVATIVAGPIKIAFKVLQAILGAFNLDILDLTAWLGDGIVGFRNWIKNLNFLERGIQAVVPVFTDMIDAVRNWIDGMKEAENIPLYIIQGLVNGLKNGVKTVIDGVISLGKGIIDAIKDVLGIHSPSLVFFAIGGFIVAGLIAGIKYAFPEVFDVLKGFGEKCIGVLGNIDWGSVLAIGSVAGFLLIAYKFADALGNISNAFDGLGSMFEDIGEGAKKVMKSFAGLMNSIKFQFYAEAVKDMAISIAILAGAIIALTFFKPADLWNAVAVIAAVAVILGVLAFAMTKISKNSMTIGKEGLQTNGGFGAALLSLAASILMITFVVKMIGKMDQEQAKQGFKGLVGIVGALLSVLIIYGKVVKGKPAQNIDKLGKMLTKLMISMLLMIVVIKLVSKLDGEELFKGAVAMVGFTLFVKALVKATAGAGKNINKVGSMLIKLSIAMGLMVGVIKLISTLEWSEMGKGVVGMAGFALFVFAMTQIVKGAGKDAPKIGGTLLAMSTSMLILVGVIKLISMMKWEAIGKGLVGLTALTGIMFLMVKMVKMVGPEAAKMGKTLFMMSLSIGILGAIAVLLSLVDTKHLVKGIIAVGLLAGLMSVMIYATKDAQSCVGNLIVMTAAIAILAGALALLSLIDSNKLKTSAACLTSVIAVFGLLVASTKLMKNTKSMRQSMLMMLGVVAALALVVAALSLVNPTNALGNTVALSVLLLAFSASLAILGTAGRISTTVTKNMLPMLGVVAGLALILGVLGALNVEASLQSAIALGVLLTALSASLVIISYAGNVSGSAMLGMLALSGVVAILAIVLGVMSALDVEGSIQTAISIGILLTAMSAALVIASYAGPNALMSVAALALMAVVVGLLGVVLGLMAEFNVEPSIETAAALSLLLIAMSAALVLLAGVGLLGPAAFIGIAALATMIAGIGGLIVAIGALFDKFPMLEEFLDKGIPILGKIGEGLGAFFGGIVGGFIEGVADSLPHLGTCLSDFITNAQPFIEGIKQVDGTALAGVGILAAAIIALTAADLINGIATFLSGGDSFASLGTELSTFMTNAKGFMDGIGSIDASTVEAVKSLAEAILIITAADLINGITSFFAGESSLSNFAAQLPLLGTGISGLVNALGDTDVSKVSPAADAVKALASAAQEIPNAGGLLAKLVGDNELGTFASQFPKVGIGIRGLVNNLGDTDTSKVEPAAKAVKILAKAAQEIPNSGGLLASLVGDNDLGTFALQFPKVGIGIKGLVTNLGGVDTEKVGPAADAVKTLAKVAQEIPNSGGLLAAIVGDNDLGTFATQFPKVGTGIKGLINNLDGVDISKVNPVVNAVKSFVTIANDIPNMGGVISWFSGDNGLDDFGKAMAELGGYIYDYYTEVCLVDTFKLKNTVEAVNDFVGVAKIVNGFSFSGIDNLKSAFDKFAEMKLDEFKTKFSEGATAAVNRVRQLAEDLSGLKDYADKTGVENLRSALNIANALNIAKFKEQFAEGLSTHVSRMKSLATGISGLSDVTIDTTGASNLKSAVGTLASAAVPKLIETFSGSVDDATADMKSLVKAINDLTDLDTSKTDGFKEAVTTLANTGVSKLIETFDGSSGKLKTSGAKIVESVVSGLKSKESSIAKSLSGGLSQAITAANGCYGSFYSAGSYVASGFANGISANAYKATAQARAMAKAAAQAAEEALGIASPSKVFRAIGNFAGLGFVNELHDYADKSYDAGSEMADSARSGLQDAINKVLGIMNGSMDVNPTIRPVLDLSGVESGVGILNSMFGNESAIGVTSNLRAIDSSMRHYGQNGGNDDVIRAINKLGNKLESVGGTTNIFEGITYGSDDEINDAVSTLVRAARMERRA